MSHELDLSVGHQHASANRIRPAHASKSRANSTATVGGSAWVACRARARNRSTAHFQMLIERLKVQQIQQLKSCNEKCSGGAAQAGVSRRERQGYLRCARQFSNEEMTIQVSPTMLLPKIDFKKELRHRYNSSAKEVSFVDVPPFNFLMIDKAEPLGRSAKKFNLMDIENQ